MYYCDYNCTVCGEVCPSSAIQPLALSAKQQLQIGASACRQAGERQPDKAGKAGELGIDVMRMSQEKFAKLDEETKAKLRGDEL